MPIFAWFLASAIVSALVAMEAPRHNIIAACLSFVLVWIAAWIFESLREELVYN